MPGRGAGFANLAVPDFIRLRSYIDSLLAPRA
jgi:hypothetical protein